jgi:hypothetical protein
LSQKTKVAVAQCLHFLNIGLLDHLFSLQENW